MILRHPVANYARSEFIIIDFFCIEATISRRDFCVAPSSKLPRRNRSNFAQCYCVEARVTECRSIRNRASLRGVASAEAVVALPTLVLLLFCVLFVSRQATARHHAESLARTCAWYYSADACEAEALAKHHPECNGLVAEAELESSASKALQREVKEAMPRDWTEAGTIASKAKKCVTKALEGILTSVVMTKIQKDAEATVSYEVTGIDQDKGTAKAVANSRLPCNIRARTPVDLARQAWDDGVVPYFEKVKSTVGL